MNPRLNSFTRTFTSSKHSNRLQFPSRRYLHRPRGLCPGLGLFPSDRCAVLVSDHLTSTDAATQQDRQRRRGQPGRRARGRRASFSRARSERTARDVQPPDAICRRPACSITCSLIRHLFLSAYRAHVSAPDRLIRVLSNPSVQFVARRLNERTFPGGPRRPKWPSVGADGAPSSLFAL